MAYSHSLADRVRHSLRGQQGVTEKRMFGGLGFLLNGNLLVGIWDASLIVRLGHEQATVALPQPHVSPFDPTGRPMRGWVIVEPDGLETDAQLGDWIERATEFAATLPVK